MSSITSIYGFDPVGFVRVVGIMVISGFGSVFVLMWIIRMLRGFFIYGS